MQTLCVRLRWRAVVAASAALAIMENPGAYAQERCSRLAEDTSFLDTTVTSAKTVEPRGERSLPSFCEVHATALSPFMPLPATPPL
jgi:hypothetical protein